MEFLIGLDHHNSPPALMDFYDPDFDSSSTSSDPSSASPSDSGASTGLARAANSPASLLGHGIGSSSTDAIAAATTIADRSPASTNAGSTTGMNGHHNWTAHALEGTDYHWTGAHEASPPPPPSSEAIDIDDLESFAAASPSRAAAATGAAVTASSSSSAAPLSSRDFWSTAPNTTVHSPSTPSNHLLQGASALGDAGASMLARSFNDSPRRKQLEDEMEVEFESVVHGHECGPSTIGSPVASGNANGNNNGFASSSSRHEAMSMPVDLSAVNAGIAPQLMGGNPSPLLNAQKKLEADAAPNVIANVQQEGEEKEEEEGDEEEDELLEDRHAQAASHAKAGPSQGNSSMSRSSSFERTSSYAASREPSQRPSLTATAISGSPLNLVTKDAVIASQVLTRLTRESDRKRLSAAGGLGDVQLLVLGIPTIGAKSRVETQIKISLVLVKDKQFQQGVNAVASTSAAGKMHGEAYMTLDGGLESGASQAFDRIGNWTHVRLPSTLALKKKPAKKTGKTAPDPPAVNTLTLEVAVRRGTQPNEEIMICTGCQQREMKRAQRKKGNKTAAALGEELVFDPEEEKQKVVVFNCGEFLEFSGGETVIPTRITCYCRHHKERKGFVVTFTARDHDGNIVATGQTPPIMITDDHKTTTGTKPACSVDMSSESVEQSAVPSVAPSVASSKSSTSKKAKAVKKKKSGAPSKTDQVISAASLVLRGRSKPTKRTTNRSRAARGLNPESDDEDSAPSIKSGVSSVNLSRTSSRSEMSPNSGKKAKPYDSDQRPPRKRSSNGASHRSPSFAMTSLSQTPPPPRPVPDAAASASIPGSTPSINLPLPAATLPVAAPSTDPPPHQPRVEQWESALGLVGGIGMDLTAAGVGSSGYTMMADSTHVVRNNSLSHSTDMSTAPSPARSSSTHFDWPSRSSSPQFSPRSATTSVDDSFQSFFNSLGSPPPMTTTNTPTLSNASRSPVVDSQSSMAHRHLQQQQQQYQQQQQQREQQLFASGLVSAFGGNSAAAAASLLQPTIQNGSTSHVATPLATNGFSGIDWTLLQNQLRSPAMPAAPQPRISRLIPGEGPIHGGIEVTVLGDNFVPNLTCVFGDNAAVPTHYWSANTLVCVLPPSANPGPVVVGIKGVPLTVEQGTGLQLFTYKDDSDRSLLELALQVVGLKMTGRLEDASAVAMRIVGNGGGNGGTGSGSNNGSRTTSPTANGASRDAASLAMSLEAAAAFVYKASESSRPSSRAHSRRPSVASTSGASSPVPMTVPLLYSSASETRNFEGIVLMSLSLLDLDPSLIPGSAPSLPLANSPISHANAKGHTLLHLATVLGFHRLTQFLLARQVDVDVRDRSGYTALHFAALYGRVAIARQLLDAGAATGVRNLQGKIALDIARERDDVDIEEILYHSRPSSRGPHRSMHQRPRFAMVQPTQVQSYSSSEGDAYGDGISDFGSGSEEHTFFDEDDSNSDSDSDSWDSSPSASGFDSEDEVAESAGDNDEFTDHEHRFSRRASRNASIVSLQYLLEAEEDVLAEADRPKTLGVTSLDVKEPIVAPAVATVSSKQQGSIAPTGWLFSRRTKTDPLSADDSEKSSTRVPPGEKLSTGVVTDMWEKAKANAFAPLHHIPAMASMPSFLGGKSEQATTPHVVDDSDADSDATTTERSVAVERAARAAGIDKDWSAWFTTKNPSSPPPVYSPTDRLLAPLSPSAKSQRPLGSAPTTFAPSSTSSITSIISNSPSGTTTPRTAARGSRVKFDKDKLDLALGPKRQGVDQDRMLWLFCESCGTTRLFVCAAFNADLDYIAVLVGIPVLITVISFAIYANADHMRPALEQFAELVLPRQFVKV
ncbi:BQ2448_6374 [Microbotryum intermedium]|uniref:BQ2448_6374 protein n=1 Tax=Microbotryum intermedium TaxID=269621 RepID=A0A238FPX7_9BASI|nr:BQ2448_6374 [Microbotryum intermedium]